MGMLNVYRLVMRDDRNLRYRGLTGIEDWWATQDRDPRGQLEVVLTAILGYGASVVHKLDRGH